MVFASDLVGGLPYFGVPPVLGRKISINDMAGYTYLAGVSVSLDRPRKFA
jgi:hypothetical protein